MLLRGFLSGELFRRGLICRADDRGDPVVQVSPPLIAGPDEFAAHAGNEALVHAGDVTAGLGVAFDPTPDLCARLLESVRALGITPRASASDDPFVALLEISGRTV